MAALDAEKWLAEQAGEEGVRGGRPYAADGSGGRK